MEVVWSDIALECLAETIDYTYETFGERQVNTMLAKIDSAIKRIQTFPASAPILPEAEKIGKNYRNVQIEHTLRLIYFATDNLITILFVGNNGQDLTNVIKRINRLK